eukprot:3281193-Pyramimonas_sp.AAC.1
MQVATNDGPITRRKRRYVLTTDQKTPSGAVKMHLVDRVSCKSVRRERAELFRGTKVYISFATTLKTEAGLRNSNTREKGGDWPSSTSTYVTVSFLRSALLWKSV